MSIEKILDIIRPNAEWTLRGDTLTDLEWHDTVQVKPTQAELDAGQLQVDDIAYKDQRRVAYPPLGDQFDALWKCLQKLKDDGIVLGVDGDDMIDQVNAIKTLYPKP